MDRESNEVQAGGPSGLSALILTGPVGDVLEALAWQEGGGVPRGVLPALVAAVTGRSLAGDDAAALLEHAAANHVDRSTSGGDVLYRLADADLGRRLREHTLARARATAGLADGWSSSVPSRAAWKPPTPTPSSRSGDGVRPARRRHRRPGQSGPRVGRGDG